MATALTAKLQSPAIPGKGGIAPIPPPVATPTKSPVQAGAELRGHPLPTNQWWTSALVGPWTQPLIAGPVGVQITSAGIAVSYQQPIASADHIIQPFRPAIVAAGSLRDVQVVRYGAFDLTLASELTGGGSVETTIVQGSPIVYLRFNGVREPRLHLQGTAISETSHGSIASTVLDGQRWQMVATSGTWHATAQAVALSGSGNTVSIAIAPVPANATRAWLGALTRAGRDPVTDTTESLHYDPSRGVARQVLQIKRLHPDRGPWALTPLQQRYLAGSDGRPLAGSYASSTGRMSLIDASVITIDVPESGFLPGVPHVPLSAPATAAVRRALAADLAQKPVDGGSYFGAKELAREASIAEVAAAVGDDKARREALARLKPRLIDWLTYRGPSDPHYFAYDPTWGGLIAVPAEFGDQDYNDHHFQYGYFVRAAATMAAADPAFARAYAGIVNAISRDYAGGDIASVSDSFPSERVWDPGVEHSWASGYALFADGNNEESSSEAVAAWAAIAYWALVTDQPRLADLGLARYALEAAAARMYWLGDQRVLPHGYAHRSVGIIWGDKIDYATWFSPAPAAIDGIQLLPIGFDGLYSSNIQAARARLDTLRRQGPITQWGNVFAIEAAPLDPTEARSLLADTPDPEPSTSNGLARYLVEVLSVTGLPDPTMTANSPFGLAMRQGNRVTLLTNNPTNRRRTVKFRRDGRILHQLDIPPYGSLIYRGTLP